MHRTINSLLMLATLAAAFALYAIKYDTRKLETRVQGQERALEKAESDVTILTAERAHLARPERLEPLARSLGMVPIRSGQYVRVDLNGKDPEGRGGEDARTLTTHAAATLNLSPQEGAGPAGDPVARLLSEPPR